MKNGRSREAEQRRTVVNGIENYSHMPHIVWLSGSELTNFKKLLQAFQRFRNLVGNQSLKMEDTFHVWSKSEGFWRSEGTILISIQATLAFTDFLVKNYPVDTTSKDSI